jgi:hypothetical protein
MPRRRAVVERVSESKASKQMNKTSKKEMHGKDLCFGSAKGKMVSWAIYYINDVD